MELLTTFVPLAVVFLVIVPLAFSGAPYWLNVMTNVALLSFASLGVWLTFSIGRVNIAQGAFCMLGGCIAGILATMFGVSFWIGLPVAALLSGLVGALIGWPLLRLRGIYFAMVTLSLTEAMRLVFLNLGASIGGGIVNIPRPALLGSATSFYFFAALLLLAGYLIVWRLAGSRLGWIFRSIREDEELAMSIGIDVARYRVLAFSVSSAMGGIAGACFAVFQQNIYPSSYTVSDSINFMLYCFLGGLEFVLGPIVGTFALVLMFELLRSIQEYQALLYGLLMVVFMLFLPNGLLSLVPALLKRAGGRR